MAAEEVATSPMPMAEPEQKSTFFRQSGWVMFATFASGGFTLGVHLLNKAIPPDQYATFVALLAVTLCIPAMPLQMVFARETAAAVASHRERQLSGMIRIAWIGTFILCFLAAIALLIFQRDLMARWNLKTATGLWATLAAILFTFWMPMFTGVMQGQQNFVWFGWSFMASGVGRLAFAALFVFALSAYAAGLMAGVAIGLGLAAAIGIWQTRSLWLGHAEPFDQRALFSQIIPLMLGFGAYQFLFAADTVFVRTYLPKQSDCYAAAGTLSRALIWAAGALVAVMFPKLVRSAVRAEKTDVMGLTLLCTAVIAGAGVVGLWVVGPWMVRLIYTSFTPEDVETTTRLLAWYAAAMVPLALASVLVNGLLARSDFRVVPVLMALAVAYGITLLYVHSSLVIVVQVLGTYNLILLAVCALFNWGVKPRQPAAA